MEGWVMNRPALVNGRCPVTVGHVRAAGGGLAFDGYASFGAAVDRLLTDERLARRLGAAGRRYVDDRYRWPVVIDHYRRFLELTASRRRNLRQ
jgi:glycosyltransferase involved in cell wall biosynthesis